MPATQPDSTSPRGLAEEPAPRDSGSGSETASGSGVNVSLDQFRQALEDQRRQTAQLQSLLEARFEGNARGSGATDKVESLVSKIESLASRLDSIGNGGNGHASPEKPPLPPQVNGLMLRVGELERKITEATPEPLLKEIVFRLGALEDAIGQSPDGGGIGEIRERVKALERRKSESAKADPRVDDLTERLAAVENQPRGVESSQIGEMLARLHSLEEHADSAPSAARLRELEEKIGALTAGPDSRYEEDLNSLRERMARIETAASAPRDAPNRARLDELGSRVEALGGIAGRLEALESKVAEPDSGEDSAELVQRLEAVENWAGRLSELERKSSTQDPRIDEIFERLDKLNALDDLAGRLTALEERAAAAHPDPRVDEIASRIEPLADWTNRLERLERDAAGPTADPRFDSLEARLNLLAPVAARVDSLELKAAEPPADPRVDEIKARLGAMADVARIGDVESRIGSLATRLDALKMITDGLKATQKPAPAASEARLDELAKQIGELQASLAARADSAELTGASAGEDLLKRIETLEKDGTPSAHDPRFTELSARLATLEKAGGGADPRVTEILARLNTIEQPGVNPKAAAVPAEIAARIDALEKRLSGPPAKGADPLVAQLRERWEILEERVMRIEEGGTGGEDALVSEDLRRQIAGIREKLEGLVEGASAASLDPQTVETLREMARTGPPSGGGIDLKTVKSQMTFVYFSIGMLYAICAYAGFVMLSSN